MLVHSRLQGKCDDRDWTQCNDKRGIKRMIHEGKWSEFIREIPIKKGDHFILPNGFGTVELQGDMQIIASTI